jgi:RNA polymerase sigma-70 factor (ECF subfamily)
MSSITPKERSRQAAALMARYCDGDASASRALYELTSPQVYAYLRCLVRPPVAAEEVLQLTFIKLHRARRFYVRGADPLPWLHTIAHRTFLDELRRIRRARETPLRDDDLLASAQLDGAPENYPPEYSDETVAAVLDAVERLPEIQRSAILLTKLRGQSMAQAAAILGTTPGAVKLRAHRAYVALRQMLGENSVEEEREKEPEETAPMRRWAMSR